MSLPLEKENKRASIRYGMCWEDADVLLQGLESCIEPDLLSIASGGDNTLALLALNPRRLVAIDSNLHQLHLLELKISAFRSLTYSGLIEFCGGTTPPRSEEYYEACRPHLSERASSFWDRHRSLLTRGLWNCGKLEKYLHTFRNIFLPLVQSGKNRRKVLNLTCPEERRDFYQKEWNSWRWRFLLHSLFSKPLLGSLGREKSYYRHAQESLPGQLSCRIEKSYLKHNPGENPYLQKMLAGRFITSMPFPYRPENHAMIKERLSALELHHAGVRGFLSEDQSLYHGFNLSNIFEYMSPGEFDECKKLIHQRAAPGARLVYWNLLVPRSLSGAQFASLEELVLELRENDKVFFYKSLHVDRVIK